MTHNGSYKITSEKSVSADCYANPITLINYAESASDFSESPNEGKSTSMSCGTPSRGQMRDEKKSQSDLDIRLDLAIKLNPRDERTPNHRSVSSRGIENGAFHNDSATEGSSINSGDHYSDQDMNYTNSTVQLNSSESSAGSGSDRNGRSCCTRKMLYKRIPALKTWANYKSEFFVSDLVAGLTVGLTMIPQAIAYANVAGLPTQYGLYSAFTGCFVYALLGSVKDSCIGPTAIMALLIRENIHGMGPQFAILLCFLTGLVQLLMGMLQLGFLVDFISGPVSVGFTSAASIIIATTQIKDLLGLNFKASSFLHVWDQLVTHASEIRPWDATLGISCMIIIFILRKIKDIQIGSEKGKTWLEKSLTSILWFISTGRNILVVIACASLSYYFKSTHDGRVPFRLSESMEPGLPKFQVPPFSTKVANETFTFFDMTSKLGSGIIILPLLSLLENISLAKVFSNGARIDATQELLALGACNVISSFAGSMPLSGGLSRGAVNNASGARTTFSSIYAGSVVIISLMYFTPFFVYIPKAALAAVIVAAVICMIEFHVLKPIWHTKKIDLIPAVATFLSCLLLRLEVGIVIGIGINVLFLLYASARPTLKVERLMNDDGNEFLSITPDRSLVFPSVDYVRNLVSKAGTKQGFNTTPVVIDCSHVQAADYTTAEGMKVLIEDFVIRKQPLIFCNLKPRVLEMFRAVKPIEFQYCHRDELDEILKDCYSQIESKEITQKSYYGN